MPIKKTFSWSLPYRPYINRWIALRIINVCPLRKQEAGLPMYDIMIVFLHVIVKAPFVNKM